jgi:parvulin-like peptidyl-prolyl isomerase
MVSQTLPAIHPTDKSGDFLRKTVKRASMSAEPLLVFADEPISLAQALNYLQNAGKLQNFVIEILRQHLIEQEIERREDLEVSSEIVEQAVIDFRLQNQLTEPEKFKEWLAAQNLDYVTFHKRISANFKMEALRSKIAERRLSEYFIEKKLVLDKIVLSRIVVDSKELAEELCAQIEEGESFESLAQEYSLAEDRIFKGMMGLVSRGAMPDQLRSLVDKSSEGEVIGPLEFAGSWGIFRVEKFQPASLEDRQIKQGLEAELFEQWIAEKLRTTPIKLQVN